MSYNKTNWQTGDVITAEKLNNMENGIAGLASGVFVIHLEFEDESIVTVESWDDITEAVNNNIPLVCQYGNAIIGDCQVLGTGTPGEIQSINFDSIKMIYNSSNNRVTAQITNIIILEDNMYFNIDNVHISASSFNP